MRLTGKSLVNWTFLLPAFVLILSACNLPFGSSATPAVEAPLATLELPPTPTPTIEPFVPEAPTIGSTISWFDTSTLVFVPGGEFTMGADEPEKQDFNPAHQVDVGGFWIYSTKVTNEMYNLCVSLGQCTPSASNSNEPSSTLSGTALISFITGPDDAEYALKDLPVTDVTWNQADNYCKWVGGRLPTEAEWEKTARGTKIQAYPWGDEPAACNFLNFKDCVGLLSSVLDHPEGISDYMALDMAGNAYEWVNDWYAKDYYAQSPASNPIGPADGAKRVVRGSSFDTNGESVLSYTRSSLEPDQSKIDVGFRCVIDDPTVFAPICEAPAAISASVNTPESGQSASGTSGSSSNIVTMDMSTVPVNNSPWCADKSAKLGGATVTWDTDMIFNLFLSNCPGGGWYLTQAPISGSLKGQWIFSPTNKLIMSGPEGASFKFILATGKCGLNPLPAPSIQGVSAVCPQGYTLQSNGTCQYIGTSGQPASVTCPGGYSYNEQTQCCTQNPPQAGNQTNQYPVCGPGNIFDPQKQVCYKPGSSKSIFVPSTMIHQFKLGTCEEPKDSDKPSQPQQPTPPFCDPATGACP